MSSAAAPWSGCPRSASKGPASRSLEDRPAPADLPADRADFGLVASAMAKDTPDGLPWATLAGICDDLLEAFFPDEFKRASIALAVDWTDAGT